MIQAKYDLVTPSKSLDYDTFGCSTGLLVTKNNNTIIEFPEVLQDFKIQVSSCLSVKYC